MKETEAIETIGRLIKEGRLERGLSQVPFSKLAGLDAKTLATAEKGIRIPWETNQRKLEAADPDTLRDLADRDDCATRRILEEHSTQPIIALSLYDDSATIQGALEAGAAAFIAKSRMDSTLVDTIRTCAAASGGC